MTLTPTITVGISRAMNPKEAIALCATDPSKLHELDPFLFESVVAELLASFGWEVNVTRPTRDGGYDILAVATDPSGLQTSWLVECKRYQSGKKVSVETARQLLGVKTHLGVPNALLVTTSSLTADAQQLSSARQDLHFIDHAPLVAWLRGYAPPKQASHTATRSFASCFISHSSEDSDFVQKLATRMRQEGIHVWYAPEDILPGEKIFDQVKKAISSFDRLLVVLSIASMNSNWVQTELVSALKRERETGRRVVFPIALVGFNKVHEWECVDSDSGIDIARELRSYHIPNFSNWHNTVAFEKQLKKVIAVLGSEHQRVSPRLVQRLTDLGLGKAIAGGIIDILQHPLFPSMMSLSGEVVQNPMWDSSRIKATQTLVDSFRPDGPNPPRIMPLDIFLIKGQDPGGRPRLLTYFSGKPRSGWKAYLLPFRQRDPGEDERSRLALDGRDLAAFLGIQSGSVHVSIADRKYALSIKPDPGYHDLVIYAFTFCYVKLRRPPKWLAHIDATEELENSARRFRWFHPEEFEQDADIMLVNADLVRAIHNLFATTLPGVPLSVPRQFLLA